MFFLQPKLGTGTRPELTLIRCLQNVSKLGNCVQFYRTAPRGFHPNKPPVFTGGRFQRLQDTTERPVHGTWRMFVPGLELTLRVGGS